MDRIDMLLNSFPEKLNKYLTKYINKTLSTEIRFKAGRGVLIYGGSSCTEIKELSGSSAPGPDELKDLLAMLSEYSLNIRSAELKNGFFTMNGGHRVGVCASLSSSLYGLSSLNIRIAREVPNCANEIYGLLQSKRNILIKGPVASGKTTILRDMIRWLSIAPRYIKTAVIDERREIAAVCGGIPQFDIGLSSDVLDGVDKTEGCSMAVRALSPEYIVCDEIGGQEDVKALAFAQRCGCKIIASVHSDFKTACLAEELFDAVVMLRHSDRPGEIEGILIEEG